MALLVLALLVVLSNVMVLVLLLGVDSVVVSTVVAVWVW